MHIQIGFRDVSDKSMASDVKNNKRRQKHAIRIIKGYKKFIKNLLKTIKYGLIWCIRVCIELLVQQKIGG